MRSGSLASHSEALGSGQARKLPDVTVQRSGDG